VEHTSGLAVTPLVSVLQYEHPARRTIFTGWISMPEIVQFIGKNCKN